MRAGILKNFIWVYRPTVTTNSVGEQVTTYTFQHSYRARVVHRGHNRTDIHGEIAYPNVQELQVRIYADIQDYDIIKFQDHFYRLTTAPLKDTDLQLQTLTIEQVQEDITIQEETEENG